MSEAEKTPQEQMTELLEGMKGLSEARREAIMDLFVAHLPREIRAVWPSHARGAVVQTVEAYGLSIDVTANGTAARVALIEHIPSTSETLDPEWWDAA